MPEILRTPLYAEHAALQARMAPFAGWEMPLLYRGIIAEHCHTREKVSIFDVGHMGEFELRGPSAEADLEKLLTQSVAAIPPGGGGYGYLLNETGGVLDDLICYRFDPSTLLPPSPRLPPTRSRFGGTSRGAGPEKFWLVVNAATRLRDAAWIKSRLSPRTEFRDISAETAKLDIQGPLARPAMEKALEVELPDLAYYHFQPLKLAGVDCVLSRTGYTGEFGYELYLPVQAAVGFWRRLLAPGVILPAGLGARDTLRVEMGFPLYGHELTETNPPAGAARGKFIDLQKDFIGKPAVLRALEEPAARQLVGLQLAGRQAARPEDSIFDGARAVGKVTSGLFAPSLNTAVALGSVERPCAGLGQKLSITAARGKKLSAEVVNLPFYKHGTARQK